MALHDKRSSCVVVEIIFGLSEKRELENFAFWNFVLKINF